MASRSRTPEPALLAVRVSPGARRDEVVGWAGTRLRVRVAAPPEAGRANRAVADLLAATCAVPRAQVVLVAGAGSRDKLFRVGGLSPREIESRLGARPA
jgi:uncharacterized protein (TIGR00251 family)